MPLRRFQKIICESTGDGQGCTSTATNTQCLIFERYRDSQDLLLFEQLKDSPVQIYKPFQAK